MGLPEVIEAWKGDSFKNVLRDLYIEEDLSITEVAKELHISVGVVHKYLTKYGINKQKDLFKV